MNFDILMSKDRKNCLCTAMLYDPEDKEPAVAKAMAGKKEESKNAHIGEPIKTQTTHEH